MNRKKIIAILFISLLSATVKGQIYLRDKNTRNPISNAHLLTDKGQLLGLSDLEGKTHIFPVYNNYQGKVVIEHLSYDSDSVDLKELIDSGSVYLSPKINQLPEVVVTQLKEYDFIVLKGYYRSYQLNDQTPVYYSDGIIEYLIPKDEKGKVRYKILHNRSFKNNNYINVKNKKNITVEIKTAGVSNYSYYWLPYVESDFHLVYKDTGNHTVRNKRGNTSGKALIDSVRGKMSIYIDCLYPDSVKTSSLFGYTSMIRRLNFSEQLNTIETNHINISNMESCKLLQQIDYKHKKEDNYIHIDGIDEFYTIQVDRVLKKDINLKAYNNRYELRPSSDKTNFQWLDIYKEQIPELNHSIYEKLNMELVLF